LPTPSARRALAVSYTDTGSQIGNISASVKLLQQFGNTRI